MTKDAMTPIELKPLFTIKAEVDAPPQLVAPCRMATPVA